MTEFLRKEETPNHPSAGHDQKQSVATTSVIAAFGLTGFKIIVALATGSMGILAEAAHSGLDLLAAVATAVAVKLSGRPADRTHLYGHGKVENLSAFFETVLLLITCFWIIATSIQHIVNRDVEIQVNFWSFAVMFVSIIVDVNRSRMLYRAAAKYNSQALEADALHFSTDIWSSAVVILGLFCVKLSDWFPGLEFLHYADSVAAMIVGLIVINVSFQLGGRTINALLDHAPQGLETTIIETVMSLPEVRDCHQVRVRPSGPDLFVDLHILVDGNQTLRQAHALTEEIEARIREIVPNADVTVHPEPD